MQPEIDNDKLVGLTSVLAAAVVNEEFRSLLLSDPSAALKKGYLGQAFALSPEESADLLSIRANTLTDLAKQLIIIRNLPKPAK